jgi:two-component system chemotaxis sensor kinase CheA
LPQLSVLELVRASGAGEHRIERIKDTPVLRLRNKLLPLIYLKDVLRTESSGDHGFIVVTQVGSQIFGLVVDGVFHTEEIVIKPMSSKLRHIAVFSGTTILGDGSVIMIIDPNGIAQLLSRTAQTARDDSPELTERGQTAAEDVVSLLVFRAGSHQPKAVPLSLVTRLEEIDCRKIEISDGRHLVQYRGHLMPLLRLDTHSGLKQDGAQPILVFSDGGRSMGLVVDEIIDIVEERLNIEVASERPGVLGYAVIKGNATEIVDIGHFLPQAFADWFRRRDVAVERHARTVLLVDDSAFFRDMLMPLIKAAGCQVVAVGSAAEAFETLGSARRFDLVITDIEMPEMDGFCFAEKLRSMPATAGLPIIAITAMVSTEAIARGRALGFYDFVAKFDRTGLIAAIKEQGADIERAA